MKLAKFLALTTLVVLAACDEKKTDPKPEDPTAKNAPTTQSAAAPVPAVAPIAVDEGDLATPADFEESAEKAISKANYKTELTTLEGDIAKE